MNDIVVDKLFISVWSIDV